MREEVPQRGERPGETVGTTQLWGQSGIPTLLPTGHGSARHVAQPRGAEPAFSRVHGASREEQVREPQMRDGPSGRAEPRAEAAGAPPAELSFVTIVPQSLLRHLASLSKTWQTPAAGGGGGAAQTRLLISVGLANLQSSYYEPAIA